MEETRVGDLQLHPSDVALPRNMKHIVFTAIGLDPVCNNHVAFEVPDFGHLMRAVGMWLDTIEILIEVDDADRLHLI